MPEKNNKIVGQLVFRETTIESDGRKVMMVIGLMAFPEFFTPKGEHQYVIHGTSMSINAIMNNCSGLVLEHSSELDVSEHTLGNNLGQALLEPIWRV